MKWIHLSDLHLGKRLLGFSLLEDQIYILDQISQLIVREKPDVVLIAGDIYDKPVPPTEAITLFDQFLVQIASQGIAVMIISGNHDSPERLAFGNRLMRHHKVYVSSIYNGQLQPVCLGDDFGIVEFYLLPFLKPSMVRRFFPQVQTYTDAVRCALESVPRTPYTRRVLLAHQFVTGAVSCESEERSIGGLDQVDVTALEGFHYVALGHLHSPQQVGSKFIRYCGTPMKYSFSEVHHKKSVPIVTMDQTGNCSIRLEPLKPLHDMVVCTSDYASLLQPSYFEKLDRSAYFHFILTDSHEIPDAVGKLRTIYPNLMRLDYERCLGKQSQLSDIPHPIEQEILTPLALFSSLYEMQNGVAFNDEQYTYLTQLIEQMEESLT